MLLSALSSQQSASLKAASLLHAPLVLPSLPTGFSPLFLITVLTKVFSDASSAWFKSHCSHPLFLDLLAAFDIWLASFKRWIFFSLCAFYDMTYSCILLCVSHCSLPDPLLLTTDIHNKDSACPLLPWSPWRRNPWTHQPHALPDICSHAWSELLLFPDLPWGPCLCAFSVYLPSAGTPSQLPFGLLPGHPSGLSLDGITSGWTSLILTQLSLLTWASSIITLTLFPSNCL